MEPRLESKLTKAGKFTGSWTRSVCPYCGIGCGVEVGVDDGKVTAIRGDKSHPANFGKLCPKPAGLPEALSSPDRLTHPLRRRADGELARVSWDEALGELTDRLQTTLEQYGPLGAAFYISGQLLTEDYYAVNKLTRGYLKTNNLDSNSRLCMTSAAAGYRGAFGTDGPPTSYTDIEEAECFLLWGTNTAECHPIVFGRIKSRKKASGAPVIVVDPRRTQTAEIADLHLPIRPGTDLALANAMLWVFLEDGLVDRRYVGLHTSGFEEAAMTAGRWRPDRAARVCKVPARDIVRAARLFGRSKSALSFWTMGINQSTVGTLKNRAIINLHLATGQIGRPGAGPFSLTGQPNAMGGREVGGLAHLLPGYRMVGESEHRREVEEAWDLEPGSIPDTPGLPAIKMFQSMQERKTPLAWIVATNPAVSMPDLAHAKRALLHTDFLVVQDAYPTETTAYADLVLPAAQWGEKCGTMTNSERLVSLVEKVVEPPGEARPDWEIFADVGRRLGHPEAFGWNNSSEVFAEYTELTRGTPIDITGLSHERLRREPARWPVPDKPGKESADEHPGTTRLYTDGYFNTHDGRARFIATPQRELHEPPSEDYPMTLSTGRIKNQWHTMSRTARSAKLTRGLEGPFVEVHPEVANRVGIRDGEPSRIVSDRGSFVARARVTERIEQSTLFVPFHWGDLWTKDGSVNETTHDAACPTSGEPELKGAAVRLEPVTGTRFEESNTFATAGRANR